MDKEKIWEKFLEQINQRVSVVTFNTWFKELKLLTINDKDIVIIVPYLAHKNHIINNYMEMVEEIFLELLGVVHNIIFCLESEYKERLEQERINSPNMNNLINESQEVIEKFVQERKTNLNDKYTFENFVVGDSNRFAFSSCLAVAQNPGKLYNPLFMYGKSGLGKTHLNIQHMLRH